ncbi:MAG: hypothetical protein J1E85_04885 [Ruminococcus sp.]|nr:hypothetical protein [Ruminococcus sp.]
MLKEGRLVSCDTPQNLVNEIRNKGFEIEIEKEDLARFQSTYRVSNLVHSGDKITVRISDYLPENHKCTSVKPTLEDLYLYIFEEEK